MTLFSRMQIKTVVTDKPYSRRQAPGLAARRGAWPLLLLLSIPTVYSQTVEVGEPPQPTFKSKVQVVLVDVVVTDPNDQPIKGLPSDSFEVFEEGKPQTVASFEEHHGDHTASLVVQRSLLPPHVYSNAPTVDPPDSINVLLLDGLNTEFGDQATVRRQMIEYLKKIDPGPRLAIFTLGSRLRMVEGFTADPKALIEALNHKKWGGTPQTSPMLRTSAEDNVDQTILDSMASGMASAGGIEALQRFQQEMQATETATRISLTLDALQELSRYLTGFRGRKNILWFSGSFPQIDFPSGGERSRVDVSNDSGLGKETRATINMLAAAQVALYPIAAQGLDTQGMYQAQNVGQPSGSGATPVEKAINGQNQSLNGENVNRYFNNKAADDIASNTGGQAFYNTNGLKEAMAEVVHKGAYYYRLSYSPTDKRMLGRYRRIKVRIKKGPYATPYNISYRHGYYEENEKQFKPAQSEPETDPLKPLMSRGLPDSTEIIYNLRLLRSAVQPAPGATPVGDNTDMKGSVIRYGADFVIPVDSLDFELTPDGVRHGNIELTLVVYDHAGRPLNWIVRPLLTSLKPDIYPSVQKTGAQFHQEIDVPTGPDLYLRSGVYDLESKKAGTLEIPLSDITETASFPTPSQPGPANPGSGSLHPATGTPARVNDSPSAELKKSSSKSDAVVMDVVVTDKNNRAVKGLDRDNFVVFEGEAAIRPDVLVPTGERLLLKGDSPKDAAVQWRISSLQVHWPEPEAMVWVHDIPPPLTYTNAPLVEPATSINVLLLDGLNTTSEDQKAARLKMIKYLAAIDPGHRLAIFTLGSRVQMVEGFGSDPHLLTDALRESEWNEPPETRMRSDDNTEEALQRTIDAEASAGGIAALREFLVDPAPSLSAPRTLVTLDALQTLARYLTAFHGRKSLIWLSGSFPQIDFPAFGDSTRVGANSGELRKKMKDTINQLAAARIAVYPVPLQALDSETHDSQPQAKSAPSVDSKAADDIALNTGGLAFYSSNGLNDALARATLDGERYYELSYSPMYKTMAGRYRHIEVKVRKGSYVPPYTLAYRRGYYEKDDSQEKQPAAAAGNYSLQPLMAKGLPEATELTYNLRLLPSPVQPAPGSTAIGDNKDLPGPLTRFSADFVIPAESLDFEVTPDGVRHGQLEMELAAYDHGGKLLNWIDKSIQTSLKPDAYPAVQKAGVQFHQDIDVPTGDDFYLRSGVYDLRSGKAGTIEIPLSEITSTEDLETRVRRDFGGMAASESSSGSPAVQAPAGSHAEISSRAAEVADIPAYCAALAGTSEHPPALAKICEFSLSMRKKLPDVICDQEMKRHWAGFRQYYSSGAPSAFEVYGLHDVITAKVTYRRGSEFYDDVRIDGKPVGAGGTEISGAWSDGEFAPILAGIFVPSSKTEFRYEKEHKLHSIPALVFNYHVKARYNSLYVLKSGKYIWFPEYHGKIWLDAKTFRLLRLERETAPMPRNPIRRMETQIDYSDVSLGDGTKFVLPTHSNVLICTPIPPYFDDLNCAHNIIKFNNWHKFRATTNIITNAAP